jgi:hypothetical protein
MECGRIIHADLGDIWVSVLGLGDITPVARAGQIT